MSLTTLYCDDCGQDCERQLDHLPSCYLHPNHHLPYCDSCGSDKLPRYYLAGQRRNVCADCLGALDKSALVL